MSTLSEKEIKKIRKANNIVALVNNEISKIAKPGVTLIELDDFARKLIKKEGGKPVFLGYQGFPKSVCISVNDALIHGVPNGYELMDGDIVSIDTGVNYDGYVGDSAITLQVGKKTKEGDDIIRVAYECLNNAISIVKPGIKTGDIGFIINETAVKYGYEVTKNFVGHGLGKTLHEEPQVPCYGNKGEGTVLVEGMVICIEPMILKGTQETYTDIFDGWTVRSSNGKITAHVEHAILITSDGYEILDS